MSSHVRPSATLGASRKRKDRDSSDTPRTQVATKPEQVPSVRSVQPVQPVQPAGGSNNLLLAGYLAHEFLTNGTLFGRRWEPCLGETPAGSHEALAQTAEVADQVKPGGRQSYAEVSRLLMRAEGAHVPGVFNPTQLGRWLQK